MHPARQIDRKAEPVLKGVLDIQLVFGAGLLLGQAAMVEDGCAEAVWVGDKVEVDGSGGAGGVNGKGAEVEEIAPECRGHIYALDLFQQGFLSMFAEKDDLFLLDDPPVGDYKVVVQVVEKAPDE